ncbi:MAG: WHG domain-containing protein [Rhodoglobus sp.]|nr:WHG domain-containing protein [Rhodoglobus sp.]
MPRAGLTEALVVAEAERLADEVGLAQLSLTALAERLGVKPPSLYKHIDGQDALLRQLEARATSGLIDAMRDAAVGRSGADAVRAIASAYRTWAKAHPGRYTATLRAPDPRDAVAVATAERAVRVILAALTEFRLTETQVVDATRMLRSMLHGFVSLEAAGGFGMPQDVDRSFDTAVDAQITALERWKT